MRLKSFYKFVEFTESTPEAINCILHFRARDRDGDGDEDEKGYENKNADDNKDWNGLGWLDWAGLGRAGLDRAGLGWTGLGWTGLG